MLVATNSTELSKGESQGLPGITEPLEIRIAVTSHKSFAPSAPAGTEQRLFENQLRNQLARRIHSVMAYLDTLLVHTPRKYVVVSSLGESGESILAESILAFEPNSQLTAVEPSCLEAVTRPADRSQAYDMGSNGVASKCDLLIAAWDGKPSDKSTGTAATVRQAEELGKPVIHLMTPSLQPSRARNLRIVVRNTLESVFPSWVFTTPAAPILFRLSGIRFLEHEDSTLASLKHLDGFNEDLQRKVAAGQGGGISLKEPELIAVEVRSAYGSLCKSVTDPGAMEYFEMKFGEDLKQVFLPIWRKTSVLSRQYQKLYNRWLGTAMYSLAAAAVVTGSAITFLFPTAHYLYWAEVGEAFGIVLILWLAWYFEWQRKRIEYRMLSERLRAAIFLYVAGIRPEQLGLPPYLHAERGTHRWVINVFNSLTAHLNQEAKWPQLYFEPLKSLVVRGWLEGQLSYYRKQEARQRFWYRTLGTAGLLTFLFTMTVAILHAFGVGEENFYSIAAMNIMAVSLPAIGGAMGGVLAHREYRRNAHRYGQMVHALTPLVSKVRAASDFASLQETLLAAHHLMLREQQTWLLTVGVEPPSPA